MNKKQLKKYRTEKGFTQKKLAEEIGKILNKKYTNYAVMQWESGARTLPPWLFLVLEKINERTGND